MPQNRKPGSQQEEQRLRALGPGVAAYVDYVLRTPGIQRHRFLRELWALSRQVTPNVFAQTVERALRYRIVERQALRRIAWFCLSLGEERLPDADVDENFHQRPAYQEGCLTDEPDLTLYDQALQKILKYLRLGGLLTQWDELLAEARQGRFSHERLLKHVLQAEYRTRSDQARILRRKRAHIPELLEIETFPFARQPKLDRQRIMSLDDRFDYLTKQQNIESGL